MSEIYGTLIKISPRGIITKFEKDIKSLINDLTDRRVVKTLDRKITIYNFLY